MGTEKQMKKTITVTQALSIALRMGIIRTRPWIIDWAKKAGFGFQPGGSGKWVIYEQEFRRFLDGKNNERAGQTD